MKNFKDKVVIITGASSGIGLALAWEFARRGARVVMGARSEEKLREQAEAMTLEGWQAAWLAVDVTRPAECRKLIDTAVELFGGVDVLVCNAGISMRALLDDVELDVLHSLMDVNFWGCANCAKYALPWLQASRGSLVGISSVAGIHGLPARTGYSASKYAMEGFLETVRVENLRKGLHVMVAYPGFTASNIRFTALTADGTRQGDSPRDEGHMMTAEQAARRIVDATARRRRTVKLDFNGRATALIKKFCPSLVDRLFYNHMAKEPDSPLKR
ncbi:short chain dehydrogenase [Bacteroidia bacterium]|nr:short chain dehydrogenase [Bacteroidia bacterium]